MVDELFKPKKGDALVIVDLQNDFLPGGALGVPDGDAVIPVLNEVITIFQRAGLPIFATRDWHPPEHCSFEAQGGPWPPHCVAGTPGAAFNEKLILPDNAHVISKATKKDKDSYSGFGGTSLDVYLRELEIKRLFIGGLATDYCVLNTVKDALKKGYEVLLLTEAVRAVNVKPGDGEKAIDEMTLLGATPILLAQVQ